MRKFQATVVLVFITVLSLIAPAFAGAAGRDSGDPKNEVSIDLGMPIVLNLLAKAGSTVYPVYISYERVLSDHLVLAIAPGFAYADHGTYSVSLTTLWIELDWHPFQSGLNGFFVGPALAITYSTEPGRTATSEGAGLSVGYQFLLPWNIDIDVALGGAYGPLQSDDPHDLDTTLVPRAELAIGFRF